MYNRFDWCTYVNHIIKLEKVMIEHKVMVLGLKETFIIRVLVKKLNDAGIEAKFVPATVNDINNNWNKYSLLTYYLESGERIAGEVTRFLCDKLMDVENDRQLILCDYTVKLSTFKTFKTFVVFKIIKPGLRAVYGIFHSEHLAFTGSA